MVPSVTARFSLKYMEVQGYYLNDLPGLVLDGKELEYLYFYIPPEARPVPGIEILRPLVEKTLKDYSEAMNLPVFRLLYLDDMGHSVAASTVPLKLPILLNMGDMTVKAEQLPFLYLNRVYAALGSKGERSFKFQEKLPVYTAVEKFLGMFSWGWAGLFHYRDPSERTRVFREFSPHHILFTQKEWVDRPSFRLRLGVRITEDKVFFKETILNYPEATLEEILTLK